jgi:hypothetical protein
LFDGVAPPLATWTYDLKVGTVTIDAGRAPEGRISMIRYQPRLGTLPPVMTMPNEVILNGVPIPSNSFFSFADNRAFTYNNPGGFTGVLELPALLPPGMNYPSLMELALQHSYLSPATASAVRYFDVRMAQVPEPEGCVFFGAVAVACVARFKTAKARDRAMRTSVAALPY